MTENLTESISVPLIVELCRKPMTLDQVGQLKKGSILELAQSTSDPISLVLNGKSIGQGELIEVDGKIGIKITQISGN